MKYVFAACLVMCAAVAHVVPANADLFYIGKWKLTGAIVAPWGRSATLIKRFTFPVTTAL